MSVAINCSICFNDISKENICKTNCNHEFCKTCLDLWFDKNKFTCPMCRTRIQYFNHNGINNRIVCIIRNERLRHINNNQNNLNIPHIMIQKRTFYMLNTIIMLSISGVCLLGSLLGSCEEVF